MNLYTVYDNVALESGPVFEAKNDGVAFRKYNQMFDKQQGIQPADFKLLKVGSIDHETSIIVPMGSPEHIIANLDMEASNE